MRTPFLTYILDGHTPVPCDDLAKVEKCLEDIEKRRVAFTEATMPGVGLVEISTVFLGWNHSFGDDPPILFETMVFPKGTRRDLLMERYATWDEAEAGHWEMVERVKAG